MLKQSFIAILFLFYSTLSAASGFYGSVQPIPQKIQQQMKGYTWHSNCPVALDKLSYLTITYYGFDHKDHIGHLIILQNLAMETLQMFQTLYQHKFPIQRMVLPYTFKSTNDWASTEQNNTVGFFCRKDDQSLNKFSTHSYGIAIDINPLYNPAAIGNHKTQPQNGKIYMNRHKKHQGMIQPGDIVFNTFTQHGWKWGGFWQPSEIDYMHFQKDMDHIYTCSHLTLTPKITKNP